MRIHEVKRKTKQKKHIQVGRGGCRGKTAGRGHKGQKSRAGGGPRPEIRDRIKKIKKLRGRGINLNKSVRTPYAVVKLSDIESNFKSGDKISPRVLFDKGLIRKNKGKFPPIKIVASGTLKKKVKISGVALTNAAKQVVDKLK